MTGRRSLYLAAATTLALGGALGGTALLATGALADTTLGGFTVSSVAEASTVTYEQPNLPVPATPTLELDEGYAATTDNYGPTGNAIASVLYPGQVVANAGPQLATIVPGAPLPPAPTWPVQAATTFPQTPSSSDDQPGVTMESSSAKTGNTATADIGSPPSSSGSGSGGSGSGLPGGSNPLGGLGATSGSSSPSPAAASAVGTVRSIAATSSSTAVGPAATATATATDHGISLLGGLVTIASVTSTAAAISNGTTATLTGATKLSDVEVGGQKVTVDGSGVHAASSSTPPNPLLPTAQSLLGQLGITMTVTKPTDSVTGSQASRLLDGLRIQIDLTTLDKQAQTFSALIPPSVTAQLPLPVPNKQVIAWDLGTVDVKSTAEPAFVVAALAPGSVAGSVPSNTGSATAPVAGDSGSASAAPFDTGLSSGSGDFSTASGAGTGSAGGTGSGNGGAVPATQTAALTPLFKGIGAGLVLLALLGVGALAYGATRADALADGLAAQDCEALPGETGVPGGGDPGGPAPGGGVTDVGPLSGREPTTGRTS